MTKFLVTFINLLFVVTIFTPAGASPPPALADKAADHIQNSNPSSPASFAHRPQGWITNERFEVPVIDGLQEAYNAGDPIEFYVEGKSNKMDVDKSNGFYIAASLDCPADHHGIIAAVKYDPDRRGWKVKLNAPNDSSKQYEISVHLLCGGNATPCASVYGEGSRMDKVLPLKVR